MQFGDRKTNHKLKQFDQMDRPITGIQVLGYAEDIQSQFGWPLEEVLNTLVATEYYGLVYRTRKQYEIAKKNLADVIPGGHCIEANHGGSLSESSHSRWLLTVRAGNSEELERHLGGFRGGYDRYAYRHFYASPEEAARHLLNPLMTGEEYGPNPVLSTTTYPDGRIDIEIFTDVDDVPPAKFANRVKYSRNELTGR